jgi:endonuclease-3
MSLTPKPKPMRKPRRLRAPIDPVKKWAAYLRRYRPGLVEFVDGRLAAHYGERAWVARLDPVSELVLTILTQNTADVNAERAFVALRLRYPSPESVAVLVHKRDDRPPEGWGGDGLPPGRAPDWAAVEDAPIDELIEVIRIGGLAYQKAPRIQAALRTIREARGDYDLSFLASMPAVEARDWLTTIPGIGKKTASIVLLFCFGLPLFPIDTHVERVSKRVGLLPPKAPLEMAHEMALAIVPPGRMYDLHVNLITHGRQICHARFPKHELCALAERCRFVNPRAR